MLYRSSGWSETTDWREEERRLRGRNEKTRERQDKANRRRADRDYHARPNDHAQRFDLVLDLHPNGTGVREHGFASGSRARKQLGPADDFFTAHPDDDPADHHSVPFLEISGGRLLR
jgi:hypothetical protein